MLDRGMAPLDDEDEVGCVDAHVMPIGDIIEHVQWLSCPCRPRVVCEMPHGRLIVHHAADAREYEEPDFEGCQEAIH